MCDVRCALQVRLHSTKQRRERDFYLFCANYNQTIQKLKRARLFKRRIKSEGNFPLKRNWLCVCFLFWIIIKSSFIINRPECNYKSFQPLFYFKLEILSRVFVCVTLSFFLGLFLPCLALHFSLFNLIADLGSVFSLSLSLFCATSLFVCVCVCVLYSFLLSVCKRCSLEPHHFIWRESQRWWWRI